MENKHTVNIINISILIVAVILMIFIKKSIEVNMIGIGMFISSILTLLFNNLAIPFVCPWKLTWIPISLGLITLFNNTTTDLTFQINPISVVNYALAGSTGGLATSWNLNQNTFGAVVTPSKQVVNGQNEQVLTLSGTATNSSEGYFSFAQDQTITSFSENDYVEGIVVVRIIQKLTNIRYIQPQIFIQGAGYTPNLGGRLGVGSTVNATKIDLEPGIYTFKTAPMKIVGGTPRQYQVNVTFFITNGASIPISGQASITKIGIRKIPNAYEL